MSVNHIVAALIGAMVAFGVASGITEAFQADKCGNSIERSRGASYTVCVLCVFVASVLAGLMIAMPSEEGAPLELSLEERDALIEKIFMLLLLPALIGVRMALGPKGKKVES